MSLRCQTRGRFRRETGRGQLRGLSGIILPVVIREEERSITVAQFQRWIGQRARQPQSRQAGPDTARDDPVIAAVAAQDETRDDDVARRC